MHYMAGTATIYCIMMIYCTSERINKYQILLFTRTFGYMIHALWTLAVPHCHDNSVYTVYSFSGNCLASAPISTFMCLWAIYIQRGSDISGTLSKLHRCFKKTYFLLILVLQTISAACWTINKNKRTGHIPAKTNQQGATRAGIVFGLHARRTMNETVSYGDFNKNTFYND